MRNGGLWRGWKAAMAGVASLAVVLALLFTPVGPAVGEFLSIFRAEKFAPVTIDPANPPSSAPKVRPESFGEFTVRVEPTTSKVESVEAAQVDFPVRQLAGVPAGLASQPEIHVIKPGEVVFRFDLAKTTAALAELGVTARMPAELDGATMRVYIPRSVVVAYHGADGTGEGLVLIQGRSPTLEIPAVLDTPEMRDLFFGLAGLPPELAAQLRAIAESKTTVPVPVMAGDESQKVAIDGTEGLLVTHRPAAAGPEAPEGSYIVWQKGGVVYALGGTVSKAVLLEAAGALR